eukprot:g47532.t1
MESTLLKRNIRVHRQANRKSFTVDLMFCAIFTFVVVPSTLLGFANRMKKGGEEEKKYRSGFVNANDYQRNMRLCLLTIHCPALSSFFSTYRRAVVYHKVLECSSLKFIDKNSLYSSLINYYMTLIPVDAGDSTGDTQSNTAKKAEEIWLRYIKRRSLRDLDGPGKRAPPAEPTDIHQLSELNAQTHSAFPQSPLNCYSSDSDSLASSLIC